MPLHRMRDGLGDWFERLLRVRTLRPAEVREQDHLAALVGDLDDTGRDALDAGRVGDLAVFHRHVEVDAEQDAFVFQISAVEGLKISHTRYLVSRASEARPGTQLAWKGKELGPGSAAQHQEVPRCARDKKENQISLPIATAVSAMRLEKPHSLSYQDITRTKVPSMTLVWSMWNTEECGSWLKSPDTFGSLV